VPDEEVKQAQNEGSNNNMWSNVKFNKKGGASLPEIISVFIYNKLPLDTLKKLLKKDITINSAELKGYFRAFDKDSSSIISYKDASVRGFIININKEDNEIIRQKMQGYKQIMVDVVNDQGILQSNVIAYIKPINKLNDPPNITNIKTVYSIVAEAWRDIDRLNKLFIYNNDHELLGYYDGTQYTEQDNSDQPMINLGHPSPFLKKLQEREPTLFIKEDSQAFSQYSKLCPWNIRRYPINLTKEEKDEIDKEAPGSYHSSIEYGTNPKKKYYYICPQYWNLRTNKPVRKEDVDPTTVIGPKEVKPDLKKKYIFEFSTETKGHHAVPSFLDKKSHPKGHFIPCCFKLNKQGEIPKAQLKRIEEAAKLMAKMDEDKQKQTSPNKNKTDVSEYIQNGLKFPLPPDRKGELPITLETFFNFNHTSCYSNLKTKKFKINSPCLFRRGVVSNINQSFLEVIAAIYFENNITALKEAVTTLITIDNIQNFHNGNLSHTFSKDNYFEQDITKYQTSDLYEKMKDNIEGFKKIVNGLENFHKYILEDDIHIDYTYLWDIVCSGILKENKLPINLIILNETMDDITQNINIICPTTVHSRFVFNLNNKSIFIYKKGDYYEPLIIYKESETKIYDNIFEIDVKNKYPFLKSIMDAINTSLGECNGTIINKYYTFVKNITLIELISEIKKLENYSIIKQLMNYDGKIIALVVRYTIGEKVRTFYVPCAPSNKSEEITEYEMINDSYWNSYPTTVKYLNKLYLDSEKRIPCLPKIRVIDKSLIIGILTITNQFIMLKTPEENKYHDNLIDLNEHHYIHFSDEDYINHDFIIKNNKLTKEQDVISYLKLEQQFYNAYFNTLKVLISDIKNLQIRKKVEDILKNVDLPYYEQYSSIKKILTPLLNNFEFIDYSPEILKEIVEINICKNNTDKYCKEDGTLLLPKINLFNQVNNEEGYLNKFIDNLIRNHNIQVSIFQDKHSTIYYTDDYKLSETEILILESALFPYIDSLGEIIKKNKYIEFRGLEDLSPNEIFQLLEKDEPEKEEVVELKLNYNTNNNGSPQNPNIDLFGIEPAQEVEAILKEVDKSKLSENRSLEEILLPEVSSPQKVLPEKVSPQEVSPEEVLPEEVSPEEVSPEEVSPQEVLPQGLSPQGLLSKKISPKKNVYIPEETKLENKSIVKPINEDQSDNEEEEPEEEQSYDEPEDEEPEEEQSDDEEPEEEQSDDELEDEVSNDNERQVTEEMLSKRLPKNEIAENVNEELSDEELSSKKLSEEKQNEAVNTTKISFNKSRPKIKVNTNCKLDTMTTDIYKDKLNNGRHKCIHKQYVSLVWSNYFRKQTTVWLNFGLRTNQKDPPSISCNYFLLSLILKDCDKEEYKNQFSTKYMTDIKQYLIKGYQELINDDNLLYLIKKWKKNGKNKEANNLLKISKPFRENIQILINAPDYRLTITDFIIFMVYYKIPIVLLYQSKKTDTFSGIKICCANDSPFYYLVRVQNKICSDYNEYNIFTLHLWSNGKNSRTKMSTIRYSVDNETQIISKLLNAIEENMYTLDDYFLTKEL